MFSMTTIELSTSIPMPSANPDNEIMFKEILEKYINTTAKITLSGMEHAITSVGRMSFKNRISTMTDSSAPTIIFSNTDCTMISI